MQTVYPLIRSMIWIWNVERSEKGEPNTQNTQTYFLFRYSYAFYVVFSVA